MTYNLWELYDGHGGDRYLAGEAHGASPSVQFPQRLSLFAKTLGALDVDILLLQEVEGASVACSLAGTAWNRSGWSCFATKSSGSSPQNLAVATRLKGTARWLQSRDRRLTGPRGALELSLEGADGLTLTTVHLKSSRGIQGPEDCSNARQRMGAATALARRYQGWSSVLIAGDFNIDPADTGRVLYDRTADILAGRGFRRLCTKAAGCAVKTYAVGRSAIDLAYFRGGGLWRAGEFHVVSSAPHRGRTKLASDHFPVVIELLR
jgi:endonuclease/exonuclease/phosphatase family metal-dependent hydrolase